MEYSYRIGVILTQHEDILDSLQSMDSDHDEHDNQGKDSPSPRDQRKESFSETFAELEPDRPVVLLTQEDFREWADNTPLEIPSEESMYGIKIGIREAVVRGSGLTEYTTYNIVGEDQNGTFDAERRYSEFNYLRKKLNERWPGVFIPAIPTKQILNKNDTQVTKNRQRFLNEFLHKVANLSYLYQSQEVQLFLKSGETDIVKVLEKLKKQPVPEMLKTYQEAFPDCINREDTLKEKEQIAQFLAFIKATETMMEDLKTQARNLAESRDKFNKVSVDVYDRILPRYEANTIVEFADGSESGCIFKVSQFPELDLSGLKEINNNNPFWLLYDLLKFEQREAKGMKEAIKELGNLVEKREDMLRKIEINKEEINELSQGKTTFRSLITPGTKDEIRNKLTVQNEDLNLQKDQLLETINIATLHTTEQITKFKLSRIRFFSKVVKKVFSVEMHNVEVGLEYSRKLEEVTQGFIEA